jgi:hypothetical protein
MTTVDIATGRLLEQLQQAATPQVSQAEREAALVARTHNETIAECQRWILVSAEILERAALHPPVRRAMLMAANHYRSAANLLEVLRK